MFSFDMSDSQPKQSQLSVPFKEIASGKVGVATFFRTFIRLVIRIFRKSNKIKGYTSSHMTC